VASVRSEWLAMPGARCSSLGDLAAKSVPIFLLLGCPPSMLVMDMTPFRWRRWDTLRLLSWSRSLLGGWKRRADGPDLPAGDPSCFLDEWVAQSLRPNTVSRRKKITVLSPARTLRVPSSGAVGETQ